MSFRFAEFFTSPGKFSQHAFILEPCRFIGLMSLVAPRRDLAVLSGSRKFPPLWFFSAEKVLL